MKNSLTKKALLQKAKARLSGDDTTAAEMFLLAHKLGVKSATINFHGSGDSGSFDDADLEGGEPPYVQDENNNWINNPKRTDEHRTLLDWIKAAAEEWVDQTGIDWYNNEGGGGGMEFNFETGGVSGEVYYYEQVTGASTEWNLLGEDGEEDE